MQTWLLVITDLQIQIHIGDGQVSYLGSGPNGLGTKGPIAGVGFLLGQVRGAMAPCPPSL